MIVHSEARLKEIRKSETLHRAALPMKSARRIAAGVLTGEGELYAEDAMGWQVVVELSDTQSSARNLS